MKYFWIALFGALVAGHKTKIDDPTQIAKAIEKGGYSTLQQLSQQWHIINSNVFTEAHAPYTATVVENWQLPSGSQCCVLRISDQLQWNYQYWIFLKDDNKTWKLIATRDAILQKYAPPEQRIVLFGNHYAFLAIRELTQTGTGVYTIEERWYTVHVDGLREVLRIPIEGYLSGWNMPFDREYSTRILGQTDYPIPAVEVLVSAEYVNALENLPELRTLFAIHRTAKYKWNVTRDQFEIDDTVSQITEEGIRGLSGDGVSEFLRHNYEELKLLALSQKPIVRQWVKAFLSECSICEEKTTLWELLAKN